MVPGNEAYKGVVEAQRADHHHETCNSQAKAVDAVVCRCYESCDENDISVPYDQASYRAYIGRACLSYDLEVYLLTFSLCNCIQCRSVVGVRYKLPPCLMRPREYALMVYSLAVDVLVYMS